MDTKEKTDDGKTVSFKIPKLPEKFWIASTIFLLVASVLLLVRQGGTCPTGAAVLTANDAAAKVVDYINKNLVQTGAATLVSTEDAGGIYKVTTKYNDNNIIVYTTKDGKWLFGSAVGGPIDITQPVSTTTTQPQEVPKSDKPVIELYIFSYCPAGSAALDSFAPVGKLLGDKANFKVKFFSDMHGPHELQQNKIQLCIQKKAPGKYWDYANEFVEKVYNYCVKESDKISCDKNKSISLMNEVGINSEEIMSCVETEGSQLYQQNKDDAAKLSLQYSPSFVINNVYMPNIDRTPNSIKDVVCSAFNTAPSECSQTLSGGSTSTPSGGCG